MTSGKPDELTIARAKRRHDRRVQVRRRWAGAVLCCAVMIGVVYGVVFSGLMVVKEVTVSGTSLLTAEQVKAQASPPYGRQLTRLDTDAMAERVAELAQVESVEVSRVWPSGIAIQVQERVPVVQRRVGDSYELVDHSGVVFETRSERTRGIPAAVTASDDPHDLAQVAQVVIALRPDLIGEVVSLDQQSTDQLTVTMTQGRTVIWGGPERTEEKRDVLKALLQVKAKVYDVSSPAHPTTRG